MNYPIQYFRLAIGNTNNNITATGSTLTPSHLTGNINEKWYINYISENVFQIINASNNQLITTSENKIFLSNISDSEEQKWKIEGIEKDYDGYYLYYKITSNSDSSKALTYIENTGFSLSTFSGEEYQKFKLNLDGLEGFASNCKTSSGEKAGTIGGLLGETIFVSNKDELLREVNEENPKTIVINANLNLKNEKNIRIKGYKTIIGSFKYHTIYDCNFRSNDANGKDKPSDNIILKNLNIEARDNGNKILLSFYSSRQIWLDHIIFNSSISYNRKGDGTDAVGQFIWINTPYGNKPDDKDMNRTSDYITTSYCKFINKYWCFAIGSQNSETIRNRITLSYNWWHQNVRRCPHIMNGICHIYNNYYQSYGQRDNGNETRGIIGGHKSEILSQNNMFNGFTKIQALDMGEDEDHLAYDDNSYFSNDLNGNVTKINFSPKKASKWKPNETNYGYKLIDGFNKEGTGIKEFCSMYTGCFDSQEKFKYITDNDLSNFIKLVYDSPFLKNINFSNSTKKTDKLSSKANKNNELKNENKSFSIVKTEVYKNEQCVHTVVYVK